MLCMRYAILASVLLGFGLSAIAAHAAAPTLDAVKARGAVRCGVSTGFPGFSLPDSQGIYRGLDVDVCRAVAAATFGDAGKVQYVPLTAVQRFTALQSGEVDVLARNATWTYTRTAQLGLTFIGVNYYDGTGFMVAKASPVAHAKDLSGATICVQAGTDTLLGVQDYFSRNNLKFALVTFENVDTMKAAFVGGRWCDAITSDSTQLIGIRSSLPTTTEYRVAARNRHQGAAQPRGARGRRPMGEYCALELLRHGQRRGTGPDLGEREGAGCVQQRPQCAALGWQDRRSRQDAWAGAGLGAARGGPGW